MKPLCDGSWRRDSSYFSSDLDSSFKVIRLTIKVIYCWAQQFQVSLSSGGPWPSGPSAWHHQCRILIAHHVALSAGSGEAPRPAHYRRTEQSLRCISTVIGTKWDSQNVAGSARLPGRNTNEAFDLTLATGSIRMTRFERNYKTEDECERTRPLIWRTPWILLNFRSHS